MNQFAGSRVVEQLSRAEFEQLSGEEQSNHVQDALAALRESIPHSRTEAGAFIDLRLYVQELAEWAPTEVQRLWPFHRPAIESNANEIHAAFQAALDSGSLSPPHAQFATNSLQAERQTRRSGRRVHLTVARDASTKTCVTIVWGNR